MNKKDKRSLYRFLHRRFGSPLNMSEEMRARLFILLGGWVWQHQKMAKRENWRLAGSIPSRPLMTQTPALPLFERAAGNVPYISTGWHWKIDRLIMLPKSPAHRPRVLIGYADPKNGWNWISKAHGKTVLVAVPVNYHLSVPKELRFVGKRFVQRAWNKRVYSDKTIWECSFWDFGKLSGDEESWRKATWHQGYLVQMAVAAAVETTLDRAIAMARSRTIRAGIRSVLSDSDPS